jgi:hypothetical protein
MNKEYFVVALVQQGFLQDVFVKETQEEAEKFVEGLFKIHFCEWDDEGYISIEKCVLGSKESSIRIAQYNLDEDPNEEEEE